MADNDPKASAAKPPGLVQTLLGGANSVRAWILGASALLGALLFLMTNLPVLYSRITEPLFGVNLEGDWCMQNKVTGPDGNPNIGHINVFHITVHREADRRYTAKGIKVMGNGVAPKTPSTLEFPAFSLDGNNRVSAFFVEDMHVGGKKYEGNFAWDYADAVLKGTYLLTGGDGLRGDTWVEKSNDQLCRQFSGPSAPV